MRKQIWLNPPLERLSEQCGKAKGRDGQFSRRLGDVVERYDAILKLTPVPHMTAEEKMILGAVICGGTVTPTSIKYLDESVMDLGASSAEKALAEKIRTWSVVERLAAIESLDV